MTSIIVHRLKLLLHWFTMQGDSVGWLVAYVTKFWKTYQLHTSEIIRISNFVPSYNSDSQANQLYNFSGNSMYPKQIYKVV